MNEIKQQLLMRGFRTRKSWGQNFIFDTNLLARIAKDIDGTCLEIGPGPGGLTRQLLKQCDKVVAVEIDGQLCQFLADTIDEPHLDVISGDFLELDLDNLWKDHLQEPFSVTANLPYYITTPILMRLLDSDMPIREIRIMVQKEVAQRVVASPGGKDYGVLSLMVQCRGNARILFDVPPHMFSPAPSVTSSVLCIEIAEQPKIQSDMNAFRRCVRAGFSSRRKQLANNLAAVYGIKKPEIYPILEELDISATVRAEQLTLAQFDRLCIALNQYTGGKE